MSYNEHQIADSLKTGVGNGLKPDTATPCHPPISTDRRYIRFGPFQVDLQKELVTKNGSRISLTGRKYRVLIMLLDKVGEIVSRDSIYERLWPSGTIVDKNSNLATTINNLRKVLEDSSFRPHYIETIPGRGYVFIAPLEVPHHSNKSLPLNRNQATGSHSNLVSASASLAAGKSRFFSIPRIVSLILIGIVLGAAAVWISNHGRVRRRIELTRVCKSRCVGFPKALQVGQSAN